MNANENSAASVVVVVMLVKYVVEELVNGPIVHGKEAMVAIKPYHRNR